MVVPRGAVPPLRPRPRLGDGRLTIDQHGVASRNSLLSTGTTPDQLRSHVAAGALNRITHGWYARPDHHVSVAAAIVAGFRITCLDALVMHGVWVPYRESRSPLHVYRPRCRRPCPEGMTAHRTGLRGWPEADAVASVPLALEHALRCQDAETAAVVLESSIAKGMVTPAQAQDLLDRIPRGIRSQIGPVSAASESGSETRVVRALRRRGFHVHQQVYVDGAGFIDAYAGGLFLEIDSRSHHTSSSAFETDRHRDLILRGMGLQVLRLSYNQVWRTWPRTEKALLHTIGHVGRQGKRRLRELL